MRAQCASTTPPERNLIARHATEQDNGTWRVEGLDDDGNDVTLIVAVGDRIEVITLF